MKEKSMTEAQQRFDEQRRAAEERARHCQCRNPVPSIRSYFGKRPCVLCQRVIA